jgi:F-type H+-transporting ATPase subunit a
MTAMQAIASMPNAFSSWGVSVLAADDPLSHVVPHKIFAEITNHVLMLIVAGLLLLIVIPLATRNKSLVPSGFRNFLEAILQFIREDVARPALGSLTDRYIPFLWTMFMLILTANLLGLVPIGALLGITTQDTHMLHWGGTATSNFGITAGLAICAFLLFHISGMRQQGAGKYLYNTFLGHAPWPLWPLFIPLELVGALVKPFALAIRLFANMTGGHIVVAVLLGFAVTGLKMGIDGSVGMFGVTAASVAGAVAISLLEVFVAFLQAYIFVFLTALFLGTAVHPEH